MTADLGTAPVAADFQYKFAWSDFRTILPHAGGLILAGIASFFPDCDSIGETLMPKAAIALACICLLMLSGCGNTARGLKKDGQETSHALDNATHRVLSAGAKK